MRIKLKNSGSSSAMERHYQRLVEAGWEAVVSKETRTIQGRRPGWEIEENVYEIVIGSETETGFLFDLSDVLQQELVIYREDGKPVIEIYDDWRE